MHRNATNAVRPPSLVDTLSSGFRTLNQGLLALAVPLVLHIWYWVGPHISVRPLAQWIRSFNPEAWDQARAQLDPIMPLGRAFDLRLDGSIEQWRIFWFWRRLYAYVPSVTASRPIAPTTWHIDSFIGLFGTFVAINALMMLLFALFLLPLAGAVRGSPSSPRQVLHAWLSTLGVLGLGATFLIVVGLPLYVVGGLLRQLVPLLGLLITSFSTAVVLWFMFATSFAFDAVVMNRSGSLRAMVESLAVVRRSFWGAVGLYLLTALILGGLGVIWRGLESTLPGIIVAIVASTYVSAGLAAAHLIFFRDRLYAPVAATQA